MDYALGSWRPDDAKVGAPDQKGALHLQEAENVYRTPAGYVPIRGPILRSALGTLNSACRGGRGVRVADGTTYLVLGTATKLYLTSAGALVDRTGASVPALASTDRWSFAAFDNGVLATSLGVAAIQRSTGAAFADLAAGAPKASFVFELEKFVVACDIIGRGVNVGHGTRREGVHWSGRGDSTSWLATGTDAALAVQSDMVPLRGETGRITLALSTGTYAFIARERSAWRMDYDGGPEVMAFDEIEKERGCIAPGGGIAVGGRVYFPSEEGFLVFDGERCTEVGYGKVDRYWADFVTGDDLALMSVAHAFEERSIYFHHPSSGRSLIYNYLLDDWSMAPIAGEFILGALPIGDSLDTGSLSAANLDAAPQDTLNLDSLAVGGANEYLTMITPAHQVSTLDGSYLTTGHVKTCRFQGEEGTRRLSRMVRPVQKDASGNMAASVKGYLAPSDAPKTPTYQTPTTTGFVPARAGGWYHEVDFLFGGSAADLSGFDIVTEDQGVR